MLTSLLWLCVCVGAQGAYRPYLAPEPASPSCRVTASVYIGTQYYDAVALSKPTASPVPTVVMGAINFEVENLLPAAIEVRGNGGGGGGVVQ